MNKTKETKGNFLENFQFNQADYDYLYNFLLEKEVPLTSIEITGAIVRERIRQMKKDIEKKEKALGNVYRPKNSYKMNDKVVFPFLDNQSAKVVEVRKGNNPDLPEFEVTTFQFADDSTRQFATSLQAHALNSAIYSSDNQPELLDADEILQKYGAKLAECVHAQLMEAKELFGLGDFWFPIALLSEVNKGYLNLAEAVLEMDEGTPVGTRKILELIEYPIDSNEQLTEFSFNYALHMDERFDEVGPTGVVLWTLKQLEPEDVRKTPMTLKSFHSNPDLNEEILETLCMLKIPDELEPCMLEVPEKPKSTFKICISYPHWKAGTMPLIGEIRSIFPTAMETDKIIFDMIDPVRKKQFQAWVVIKENYVCGLKNWYRENGVIPGSYIQISEVKNSSAVEISLIPPRSSKEWVRTALFDSKGNLEFDFRQQAITTEFDERMCIYVENSPQLDLIWEKFNKPDVNFNRLLEYIFKELSKSNAQQIVHFDEIYAGVNMINRCPPGQLFTKLLQSDKISPLEDLYFKATPVAEQEEVGVDR